MVMTSYLRVYEPLSSFSEEERSRWVSDPSDGIRVDTVVSRKWLIDGSLPGTADFGLPEGAFVRKSGGAVMVCPRRTRLRMLAGLLAFRGSIPEQVAEAFVTEDEVRLASVALEEIGDQYPDVRSYISHANWHVPLRWFTAFDESERILTEDSSGLRIRYETTLVSARSRLERALEILESSWVDDAVTGALREVAEWLEDFSDLGLLELDYGSVARMFSDDELVEDRTAGEVWSCLEALEGGDVVRAGEVFAALNESWAGLRANEMAN
jgi:hypothetical protein